MKELISQEKPASSKKEEEKEQKIFLEVGTWEAPATFLGDMEFNEGDRYIGIDINKENVRRARINTPGEGENIDFMQADAKKIPLKSESASEVYLGNVLGDPRILNEDKVKFLQEAERVLEGEGKLVIKENNTPIKMEDLKKILKETGLELKKVIRPMDKEWDEEIKKYHKADMGRRFNLAYIAILKKSKS